jgi:hypothetical protein
MGRRYRGPEQAVAEQVQAWADPQIFDLLRLAERVDVSCFEQDYRADGAGGVPYDPRLMLVTVWWCCHRRWRSPQEMARACREQASLRVLWQRERVPSAACLRRFVQGHRQGWQRVAESLMSVCDQAGLVDVSVTATDSTPMIANAAISRTLTAARLTTRIDGVQQELAALHARLQRMADDDEDAFVEHGCGDLIRTEQLLLVRLKRLQAAEALARERGRQLVASRQDRAVACWQARVDRHTTELADLIRRQQEKIAAHQARPRGNPPVPVEQHRHVRDKRKSLQIARDRLAAALAGTRPGRGPTAQANTTDPQSRILKGKPNTPAWVIGRLLTITVIAGQFILAGLLSPAGNDAHGLLPNLLTATAHCEQAGINPAFTHHLADGAFTPPDLPSNKITGTLLIAVTSEDAAQHRTIYARRSPLVEPVFAQLLRTDRHLHARGDAANTVITTMTTAHNAMKYLRQAPKRPAIPRTGT